MVTGRLAPPHAGFAKNQEPEVAPHPPERDRHGSLVDPEAAARGTKRRFTPGCSRTNGGKLRGHRDWFEPALRESGVHDYSWHCNRHTFASRLVMVGVDLRTVGELLGHETPSMTWWYSHLASGHKQRAVDRLVAEGESVVDARSATRTATSEVATKLVGNDV